MTWVYDAFGDIVWLYDCPNRRTYRESGRNVGRCALRWHEPWGKYKTCEPFFGLDCPFADFGDWGAWRCCAGPIIQTPFATGIYDDLYDILEDIPNYTPDMEGTCFGIIFAGAWPDDTMAWPDAWNQCLGAVGWPS